MNKGAPRRVTRAYARGLVAAVTILALALLVAGWGGLSLLVERPPITSNVSHIPAPSIVFVCLGLLVMVLWNQTLEILRGHGPTWAMLIVLPGSAYLLWCLLGLFFGFNLQDTWLSPFALELAVVWALMLPVFWSVLLRRVYSERGTPRWPWEERDARDREDDS